MIFKSHVIILVACFHAILVSAQSPVASFVAPATACLNESIAFQNTSTAATQYAWDFCLNDLKATPFAQQQTTLPNSGTFFYHSIRYVFDGGEWIAFATDMNGNRLVRLDYGAALTNIPTITNLGTLTGFSSPAAIDLIQHNGIWYAFVVNLFGNSLVRIEFGGGIKQPPTLAQNLGNVSSAFNTPSGIKLVFTGGKYIALVVSLGINTVTILDFDSSPVNAPTLVNTVGPASFNNIYGISILPVGNTWYALLGSFNGSKTYLLNFGSNLTNTPAITEIDGIPSGADLELASEGAQQYALVRSRTDGLYRIDFGSSFGSTPTVTRLGTLGLLFSEARNIAFVRDSPGWKAFTVEASTAKLFRIDFEGDCNSQMSLNTSANANPSGFFYKTPGAFSVELTATNAQGKSTATASINVLNQSSSGVAIQKSIELCVGSTITFQATSAATLTSFNWNFDDGNSSNTSGLVTHQYASNGDYTVVLEAVEQNGCKNTATKNFSLFDVPTADFNLPVTGTVCTLQSYNFSNQTIVDAQAPVSWQWKVDNTDIAVSKDLAQSFSSLKTYAIELTASIPGCSNTISKNFTIVGAGTAVDFMYSGQCLGGSTAFTNLTAGSVSGYVWNFGDGQTSIQTSVNHQYATNGTFQVSLQATNGSGCSNSTSKSVQITDAPQPDFYIDLPPFSCSGTPTQFHDDSPSPSDANITSWNWDFNDGGTTSILQNPQHTYAVAGTYSVSLTVKTNFGCEASVQMPVEIAESPVPDFSIGPACINKGTQFQSLDASGIASWSWMIGSSVYAISNPVHTFTSNGTFQAMLITVGANGCEGLTTKNVTVNLAPTLNFTAANACSGDATLFTGTSVGVDMPNIWLWDFDGSSGSGSTVSFTFPTAGTKPVEMTVTTQAGCEYSLTKSVIIAPSPVASFTTSTSFGAPPLPVQFTNTSQNASSLSWDFGFNNSTSTSANPTFTFTQLGDYLVELTATNGAGCSDTFTKIINVMVPQYNLTLENLNIQEAFSSNAKTPVILVKNNSNVAVSSADVWITGSTGLRVKSNISINLSPGASQEFILPLEVFTSEKFLCVELDATDDVDLSDNSRCENLLNKPVLVTPYPNPTTGIVWFEAVLDAVSSGNLRIADSMGKTVYSEEFPSLSVGMNRIEVNMANQRPGLYLAIWTIGKKQSEFRFLLY